MRLSRRKDAERQASALAELQEARARLLDVRLRFIASLNALRYKRAFVFLEPLSGYLQVRLFSSSFSNLLLLHLLVLTRPTCCRSSTTRAHTVHFHSIYAYSTV